MYEDILNPAVITARVKAGAEWLDEHEPGWAERIDVGSLHMKSACRCIGGQLEKHIGPFVVKHALPMRELVALGLFDSSSYNDCNDLSVIAREYALLTQAFREIISDRRNQRSTQPS